MGGPEEHPGVTGATSPPLSPRVSPRGQFGTLELRVETPGELRPGSPGAGAALGCTAGRAHALQVKASHPRPPQSRGAPSAPPSHRPRSQSGSTLDPLWPCGPAQSPGLGPKPRETLSSRGKRQAGLLTFLPGMPCRPGLCPLHSRQPCCGGLVGLPRKYTQVLVPQLPPHKLRLTLSPLLCDSLPILPVKVTPKPIILCITY